MSFFRRHLQICVVVFTMVSSSVASALFCFEMKALAFWPWLPLLLQLLTSWVAHSCPPLCLCCFFICFVLFNRRMINCLSLTLFSFSRWILSSFLYILLPSGWVLLRFSRVLDFCKSLFTRFNRDLDFCKSFLLSISLLTSKIKTTWKPGLDYIMVLNLRKKKKQFFCEVRTKICLKNDILPGARGDRYDLMQLYIFLYRLLYRSERITRYAVHNMDIWTLRPCILLFLRKWYFNGSLIKFLYFSLL